MAANNTIPALSLRLNSLKKDSASFLDALNKNQIQYEPSKYLPNFVRLHHMAGIGKSEFFRQGFFSVQDESAGIPVALLDPKPGERILDLCAAPGGKTTYIGELMKNEGEIIAVDRYETRLHLVEKACQRLGITNVSLIAEDAAAIQLAPADKVLVDAPCSGLGVIAKKPDAKWLREPEDIPRLADIQSRILENAAHLVKPGGILVYSTCTIEPEENIDLIKGFLLRHPEFEIDPAQSFVKPELAAANGTVETFQHEHGMDGSFCVRLKKNMDGGK
jgi:16S rRNA (cytosine967-C5)-methyltransferase